MSCLFRVTLLLGLLLAAQTALSQSGCACGSKDPNNSCRGSQVSYTRDSQTIGFEFNCDGGACACGRFANDWDYWVAPLREGGTVQITRMTPDAINPGTASLRHGAQQDPEGRTGQGFTSLRPDGVNRMEDLDLSQSVNAPLAIDTGSLGRPTTILKAIDLEDRCTNSARQCLSYVETLTVVPAPPGDVFRPPYFGTEKPMLPASDLNLSVLAELAPLATTMSWNEALDAVRSVHLVHSRRSFQQGMTAAVNQQVDRGYDQFPNMVLNKAMLKLVEAPGTSRADKEALARYVVQQGIDRFHIHNKPLNAGICGAWEGAGGFNGGNLMPIILAAVMLGRDDWLATVNDNLSTFDGQQCFAETGFIQQNPERRGKGIPTFGHLNTTIYGNIGSCSGGNRNCASVGGASEASYDLYDGLADGDPLGNSGSPTAYQRCCTHGAWLGAALTAWLTPAVRDAFPDNARHFLSYMERRKRAGDAIGYHFGSYSSTTSDEVTGFDVTFYIDEHFLAMWSAFEGCFEDDSCTGMQLRRPRPPVLTALP